LQEDKHDVPLFELRITRAARACDVKSRLVTLIELRDRSSSSERLKSHRLVCLTFFVTATWHRRYLRSR